MNQEMFTIGKIVNTHGIKGELRIMPTTDEPKRFSQLKQIMIDNKNQLTEYDIETVRYHKNFVLLKLKGINDINIAEHFKGSSIKIHRKEGLPLGKDEYYISDLYGLKVYTEEERYLGELVDVIATGSNDVYVVKHPEKPKELLLPAIKQVIKEIDLKAQKIKVHLLEGLEE